MPRINHFIVLLLENRAFDHMFGFATPPANDLSRRTRNVDHDRVPALIVSPWIAKGVVEHRRLQHTSVIKTVTEMFGLNGPLNRRDESAKSFADLFAKASQPRPLEDMPKH